MQNFTNKFVVRLLDADHNLLAWQAVYPEMEASGRASCGFYANAPTPLPIERDGLATILTVHWCDLDVARMTAISPLDVKVGQLAHFTWIEPVWLLSGMRDVPLPPVTVREPVAVTVPSGALAARDGRV